jgi:hypothetical protein
MCVSKDIELLVEVLARLRQMVNDDPHSREALGLEVACRVIANKLDKLVYYYDNLEEIVE